MEYGSSKAISKMTAKTPTASSVSACVTFAGLEFSFLPHAINA